MKSKKQAYVLVGYYKSSYDNYGVFIGTEYKVSKYLKEFRKWAKKNIPGTTFRMIRKDFVEL